MQAIGIHIDGSILRRALVQREGKNFVIKGLQTAAAGVKPFYTETSSTPLVSGLSSNDVLIQHLPFQARKSEKLRQALKMQAHAQLHLKEENLLSSLLFEGNVATAHSTTRYALSSHLNALQLFGQDPDRVTAIPQALKTFVHWKAPDLHSYLIVDLGFVGTNCIWVEDGLVQQAQALSFGTKDFEDSSRLKLFRSELSRVLTAFASVGPLIMTGEECDGFLHDPLQRYEEKRWGLSGDEQRYAIPVGLALDYLMNRKEPLQFRQGSALSARTLRLFGRNVVAMLFVSLVCSFGLVLGGSYWVTKREKQLVQQLDMKVGTDSTLRKELIVNGADIHSLVNQWVKITRRNAKDYPFLNSTYRVSEVLNWLMHLPKVSLEQIRYETVSFPHLEALREPYRVKVEIELKIDDPVAVHQFHEQLKQGQGMCDASKEIIWELFPDRIQASFYLNPRETCLI